ncbi:MAG: thymidine kinase [Gammaproteobacteria bacterium RIFCSPHIGHO2_12_FULL_38_11]|nr:MAG: thymidine kinase [Gammaproteobacteria bacterium RIFCSPHIGHO2_12_FULL_38_11]
MAKLHFYYSAMNAGKSTTLLQSSYNYNERGMDTLLYTPKVDNRFGVGKITTRIGLQNKAIAIDKNFDVFLSAKKQVAQNPNIKCVLIDEAQFLSKKQIEQLTFITDFLNIPVLTYGIRSDFRGELFEGSSYLLAWADSIIELKTICHCGKKAIMNMRLDANGDTATEGEQVDIGGNEKYIATCRKHFRLKQTGIQGLRSCAKITYPF